MYVWFRQALVSADALGCSRMLCFLSHPHATSAILILTKQAYEKIFIPLTILFQATFCHLLYFQSTKRLNLISKVESFWIMCALVIPFQDRSGSVDVIGGYTFPNSSEVIQELG